MKTSRIKKGFILSDDACEQLERIAERSAMSLSLTVETLIRFNQVKDLRAHYKEEALKCAKNKT